MGGDGGHRTAISGFANLESRPHPPMQVPCGMLHGEANGIEEAAEREQHRIASHLCDATAPMSRGRKLPKPRTRRSEAPPVRPNHEVHVVPVAPHTRAYL